MSTAVSCYEGRRDELPRPFAADLRAGPVTLRFVDGDLREIRAGGEELVRRITFNVRHHRWDTAVPQIDHLRVEQRAGAFNLRYVASCAIEGVVYSWTADIQGTDDGTITYRVAGASHGPQLEIRRAGLNVLLACETVEGLPFETRHLD